MLISPEHHKKVLNQSAFRKISLILRKCLFIELRFCCIAKFLTNFSFTQQMAMSEEGWKTLINSIHKPPAMPVRI